jgi:hypothetical protein
VQGDFFPLARPQGGEAFPNRYRYRALNLTGCCARLSCRGGSRLNLTRLQRSNAPRWQQREKPMPARSTPIRGHLGQAIKPSGPPFYVLPGNALKIEVAALAAVGMK